MKKFSLLTFTLSCSSSLYFQIERQKSISPLLVLLLVQLCLYQCSLLAFSLHQTQMRQLIWSRSLARYFKVLCFSDSLVEQLLVMRMCSNFTFIQIIYTILLFFLYPSIVFSCIDSTQYSNYYFDFGVYLVFLLQKSLINSLFYHMQSNACCNSFYTSPCDCRLVRWCSLFSFLIINYIFT